MTLQFFTLENEDMVDFNPDDFIVDPEGNE